MLFIFLFFRFAMGGVESPYQVSIIIFTLELNCYAIVPIFLPFFVSGPPHNRDTDSISVEGGSAGFLIGCHR